MDSQTITQKNKIYDEISLLNQWAEALSKLIPVVYRSKISWFGGIPGAIIEAREQKKLMELINAPIVGNLSYWKLAGEIPERINSLGEMIRNYQGLLDEADPECIRVGDDFINAVYSVIGSWKRYSPAMAYTVFPFGRGRENKKTLSQYVLDESTPGVKGIKASTSSISRIKIDIPLLSIHDN